MFTVKQYKVLCVGKYVYLLLDWSKEKKFASEEEYTQQYSLLIQR